MSTIIRAEHITKRYSAHTALDDVGINIERGSVHGLLGPNGAGKTTLIRIINRIIVPDSGVVYFNNKPITENDIYSIGYLPEERGLYRKMKVGEQAIFIAQLKGLSRHEAIVRLKEWFERFGIEQWWNKKVEDLSKGMAQKLQFIVTVLHTPKLLIFDEPFSGFDPINTNLIKEQILRLRDEGATIIFSTHNMASVEEICDHITLINKSHNILEGSVEEIRHSNGANIFQVQCKTPIADVEQLLKGKCNILSAEQNLVGLAKLRVHIEKDNIRNIVALLNEKTELRSFTEVIPSMNDIFIRACKG